MAEHQTTVSRERAHAAWGHTGTVVGLHWGYGGATLGLLWGHNGTVMTHAANGRTHYYCETRARACSLGPHWNPGRSMYPRTSTLTPFSGLFRMYLACTSWRMFSESRISESIHKCLARRWSPVTFHGNPRIPTSKNPWDFKTPHLKIPKTPKSPDP